MPQISTTGSGWADVYALADAASQAQGGPAIPVGTPLLVQNQSGDRARFQIRAAQPATAYPAVPVVQPPAPAAG